MLNSWLVSGSSLRTSTVLMRVPSVTAISAQSDRATRRDALFKCKETGIDFALVAIRVVELIVAEALEESPELDSSRLFNPAVALSHQQLQLIRSLEWLSFDRATYVQAHLQANALIRWFLGKFQCLLL
jgi:nuclear pore complex protein Nup107